MGYNVNSRSSDFVITDKEAALKHLKEAVQKHGRFAFLDMGEFLKTPTLEQALHEFRWSYDPSYIYFEGEKLGDDKALFDILAPFVLAGSYIEMHGEDGYLWRWVFDGQTCKEVEGKVTF